MRLRCRDTRSFAGTDTKPTCSGGGKNMAAAGAPRKAAGDGSGMLPPKGAGSPKAGTPQG